MRRVLFDENMPRQLRRDLPEFAIRTVQEDQRMRYQQNVARFSIGIVVIETFDTRIRNLRRFIPQLGEAIRQVRPGTVVVIPTA